MHSLHFPSGLTAVQASHDVLSFGPFELHLPSRELHNGSARTTLQGQPFEILRTLLERPGSVVTRDQLRQRLWPAGTFVDYEHSLNAAIKRLRAALGDDAQNPRFVETLARRGYRWRVSDHATDARHVPQPRGIRLLVLPLTMLGGDEDFGSGLTEELIAQLGSCGAGDVGVIARISALTCTSTGLRARQVGESLDVGYLLEGGIRRQGTRMRIAVWLVDTHEEVQVWSAIHECEVKDPLAAQIDVAARIAQAVVEEVARRTPRGRSHSRDASCSWCGGAGCDCAKAQNVGGGN
jgi:TolB-like protein